jgi:ribonuclease HI
VTPPGPSPGGPSTGPNPGQTAGRITVYTDGGARPNPGPGGWGAVLVAADGGRRELAGGEPQTTNNRMELTAAIRALEAVGAGARVRLYTDSQYLRRGVTEWLARWRRSGWRRADGGAVENDDLWRRLAEVAAAHDVEWHWVRGHAGDPLNERADALATAARREIAGEGPETPPTDARIYLKVSCRGSSGRWAAVVDQDGGEERRLAGSAAPTSANRLDLEAAAAALGSLPPGASAAVYTGSEYLRRGAVQWLPAWRRRGWKTKAGGAVANRDLWERLAAAMAGRRVLWPDPADEAAARIAALDP